MGSNKLDQTTAFEIQILMNADDTLRTQCFLISRKQTNSEASIRWNDCGAYALVSRLANKGKGSNTDLKKKVEEYLAGERKLTPKPPMNLAAFSPKTNMLQSLKKMERSINKNNRSFEEKEHEYTYEYMREAEEWADVLGITLRKTQEPTEDGYYFIVTNKSEELCRVFVKDK